MSIGGIHLVLALMTHFPPLHTNTLINCYFYQLHLLIKGSVCSELLYRYLTDSQGCRKKEEEEKRKEVNQSTNSETGSLLPLLKYLSSYILYYYLHNHGNCASHSGVLCLVWSKQVGWVYGIMKHSWERHLPLSPSHYLFIIT